MSGRGQQFAVVTRTKSNDKNGRPSLSFLESLLLYKTFSMTAVQSPVAPPLFSGTVKDCLPEGLGQNGGRISSEKIGFLRPTPKNLPVEQLRQRLKEDGYLFVKDVIPREDVLDAREK